MRGFISVACLVLAVARCSDAAVKGGMTAPMSASDHVAEIEQAKARTPMPNGATWRPIEIDPGGSYGVYDGAATVEFQAACAWFAEALAADEADDDDRARAARAVVQQIPTWRGFSDPALADWTLRRLIRDVTDAALDGRPRPVAQFVAANCM